MHVMCFSSHVVVDSSLPRSLMHIVSNAEYYGPSIYLPGMLQWSLNKGHHGTSHFVLYKDFEGQKCIIAIIIQSMLYLEGVLCSEGPLSAVLYSNFT